jgi:hypothetical protein
MHGRTNRGVLVNVGVDLIYYTPARIHIVCTYEPRVAFTTGSFFVCLETVIIIIIIIIMKS